LFILFYNILQHEHVVEQNHLNNESWIKQSGRCLWPSIFQKTVRNTKIETTKATKRNLISDDFQQLSVKLVISVDSKSADFSGAGSWCFEAETEETTTSHEWR